MPKFTINPAPGRATSWGGKYTPGEEVEIAAAEVEKLTKRGVIGAANKPVIEAKPPENNMGLNVGVVEVPAFPKPKSDDKEVVKPKTGRNAVMA